MSFANAEGKCILLAMINAICKNRDRLSEIDGLIGDGDHGVNMNKGFSIFERQIREKDISFSDGLEQLGMILMNEIGGSMGPIYGTIFMEMADASSEAERIDAAKLLQMLEAAQNALYEIIDARTGDKTLVDTLWPAIDALRNSVFAGEDFPTALEKMRKAAQAGCYSTKDMVAKYGRSARLGARSVGVLDAGAASCCLILSAMCDGIETLLRKGDDML